MIGRLVASVAVAGAIAFVATDASAQEETERWYARGVRAPREAFEISVAAGVAQGFGNLRSGPANHLANFSGPGVGFDLGVAYRASPALALGLTGEYQALGGDRNNAVHTFAPGLAATLHFAPYQRIDPWVLVGTGYRLLWDETTAAGTNVRSHGWRVGRVSLGADFRAGEDVAIGPVVGVDLNLFLWQRAAGASDAAISDIRPSLFGFAGVAGRFDLGGARQAKTVESAAR